MATSPTGVYGGFSYLTANTDQQPPRSPRLSSRSSEKERGYPEDRTSDPDLQPFTYLTPNSPLERDKDPPNVIADQRESYDNRIPQAGDNGYYPKSDSRGIGANPGYYTSVKDFADQDGRHIPGELYDHRIVDENDRRSAYIVPDHSQGSNNYELSGGHIPRPHLGNATPTPDFEDPRSPRYNNKQFNYFPEGQYPDNNGPTSPGGGMNGKSRPLSRDSYLDSSHRRRGGCTPGMVCLVILLVVLALGAGFAGGWFASKYLNNDDGSTSSAVTTAPNYQPAVMSSTTTVATPVSTAAPTTKSTTTTAATTTTKLPDPPTTAAVDVTT